MSLICSTCGALWPKGRLEGKHWLNFMTSQRKTWPPINSWSSRAHASNYKGNSCFQLLGIEYLEQRDYDLFLIYTFISNILYMSQGSASLSEVCESLVVCGPVKLWFVRFFLIVLRIWGFSKTCVVVCERVEFGLWSQANSPWGFGKYLRFWP